MTRKYYVVIKNFIVRCPDVLIFCACAYAIL